MALLASFATPLKHHCRQARDFRVVVVVVVVGGGGVCCCCP